MSSRPVTPEPDWRNWLAEVSAEPFPEQDFAKVVVVAAHPDDETLGASGLVQRLHERGAPISLVVATDGEAAFPGSSQEERAELGRQRRRELGESLRAQGLGAVAVHWLGLPDSGLAAHRERLASALAGLLDGADLCLLPWPGDPHPDHRIVGETALRVAPVSAHRFGYPVWLWHWHRPSYEDIPRQHAVTHRLSPAQRERKAAGIAAFTSQLKPGPRGEEPILTNDMLSHFDRDAEVLFRQPPEAAAPISRFVELYEGDEDPWRVSDRWYERRKRAVLLAGLPREQYGVAVEPACGTGVLTRSLAARCDQVLAFDAAPNAVRRAHTRTRDLLNVSVRTGALPQDLPPGPADLIVFSEILYYLSAEQLRDTIDRTVDTLRPDGHLVAAHWRPWAPEAPMNGAGAHEILLAHDGLRVLVEHWDERFVLHVLARR